MNGNGQTSYEDRIRNAWRNAPVPLPDGWIDDPKISDEVAFTLALQELTDRNNPSALMTYLASPRVLTLVERTIVSNVMKDMHTRLTPIFRGKGRPAGSANKQVTPLNRAVHFARKRIEQWREHNQNVRLSHDDRNTIIEQIVSQTNEDFGSRLTVEGVNAALTKGIKTPFI